MSKAKKYKCNSCGYLFDEPVIWEGASEDRNTMDRILGCPKCDYRNVVSNVTHKD